MGLTAEVSSPADDSTSGNAVGCRTNAVVPELQRTVTDYSSTEPSYHMTFGWSVLKAGPLESVAYEVEVVMQLPREAYDAGRLNMSSTAGALCTASLGVFNDGAVVVQGGGDFPHEKISHRVHFAQWPEK